jgi:hypothetical protein
MNNKDSLKAIDKIFSPSETGPKNKPDARLSKYPEVPYRTITIETTDLESIKAHLKKHDEMIQKILDLMEKDILTDEPPISPEAVALILAELEKGEKEVDIAQMKEVVKTMPEAFAQFSDSQVIRFIRGMK